VAAEYADAAGRLNDGSGVEPPGKNIGVENRGVSTIIRSFLLAAIVSGVRGIAARAVMRPGRAMEDNT
jgi:hypothetical protein